MKHVDVMNIHVFNFSSLELVSPPLRLGVRFVLSGLILPLMTTVVYIIPLITMLLANMKKKHNTVCLFTIYLLPFIEFFSREI